MHLEETSVEESELRAFYMDSELVDLHRNVKYSPSTSLYDFIVKIIRSIKASVHSCVIIRSDSWREEILFHGTMLKTPD